MGGIQRSGGREGNAYVWPIRTIRPKVISSIGFMRLALGDTAAVLEALERATVAKEPWPTDFSLSEPMLDVLRANPRFAAIVRGVGLDVQTFTAPRGGRPG